MLTEKISASHVGVCQLTCMSTIAESPSSPVQERCYSSQCRFPSAASSAVCMLGMMASVQTVYVFVAMLAAEALLKTSSLPLSHTVCQRGVYINATTAPLP